MATTRFALLGCLVAALGLALAPPATASLLGYWPFEGNTNDLSPKGNNGTLVDGGGTAPYYAAGAVGQALFMDGANDRMTAPLSMPNPSNFSVVWWSNPTTATNYNQQITSAQDWNKFVFHTTATAGVYVGVGAADTSRLTPTQLPAGTVTLGTWQQFAFTYGSGTGTFYKNGVQLATRVGMQMPTAWTQFQIGTPDANTINGGVDDVAVWNQTLNATEIADLYSGALTPATVAQRENVSYRITGAAPTTGTATVTGYLNDSGVYNQLGTQFQAPVAGTPAVTATGSVSTLVNTPVYLQLKGAWNGTGTPNQTSAPYIAATFTAPPGHIFSETGNQYVSTDATNWAAHSVAYGGIGWPGDTNLYELPSPSPTLASQGHPTAPSVAPQALWQISSLSFEPTTTFYLDRQVTLAPGTWSVFGAQADPLQPQGLSAHIVRVNSNLDNLGQVDTALTRVPNGTDHSVSQVTSIPRADLDSAGAFSNPAGYLPGEQGETGSSAGEPRDYAVRLAGYVYATAGSAQSFAVSGDNRFYFKLGGVEFARSESTVAGGTPLIATMKFDATGYYPLELVYGNRDGAAGLEISSAQPTQDPGNPDLWIAPAFSTSTYHLLGDTTAGGLAVYQNPIAATTGANTVGGVLYTGVPAFAGDGLRVQQAYPVSHGGVAPTTVDSSISFFANKVIQNGDPTSFNVGRVENRSYLAMNDPQGAGAGNFVGTSQPFPIDNRDASYNLVAAKGDDNFVTRINGLVYIPAAGTYAVTNSTDDAFQLRIGDQQFGRRPNSGGTPADTANYMYGYFPQAGLYPIEYYHYEGGSGANIELAIGGTTALVLPTSRNPASNGFTPNMTGMVYSVEPRAMLKAESTTLQMQAFGRVPALVTDPILNPLDGVVPPEHWKLERGTMMSQGLLGTYYNFNGQPASPDNSWPPDNASYPVLGTRVDWGYGGAWTETNLTDAMNFHNPWQGDNFGTRWTGFINIPDNGAAGQVYSFNFQSDDRGWLFIDIDGLGGLDAAPGQPVVWSNWMQWNNLMLTPGLHAIELRAKEWGGGETYALQWDTPLTGGTVWQYVPATALQVPAGSEYFAWEMLDQGTFAVGDLANYEDRLTFDFNSTYMLRLTVDIAGLTAIYEGTFNFVPEPGTMLVLAGGLLALARRRRRAAR